MQSSIEISSSSTTDSLSAPPAIAEGAGLRRESRNIVLKRRVRHLRPAELLTRAQCEDALRTFTELATLDGKDVAAHLGRGDCFRMMDDPAAAFDCYTHVLAIDPANTHALYGCGLVLKFQERLQDAVRHSRS